MSSGAILLCTGIPLRLEGLGKVSEELDALLTPFTIIV